MDEQATYFHGNIHDVYTTIREETLLVTYREVLVLKECSQISLLILFPDLATDTDVDIHLSIISSMT